MSDVASPPDHAPAVRMLGSERESCYGVYPEGTYIAVFRGRNRTHNITAMQQAIVTYGESAEKKFRLLVVVEHRATIGKRARARVSEMMKEAEPYVSAWATIIEGTGFWSSAARAIAAGVRLISRSSYPMHVFATLDDGVRWLEEKTGEPFPDDFTAAIDSLRSRLNT